MKEFLVLFREPDGRTEPHAEDAVAKHQENWKVWITNMQQSGNLTGGKALTLNGTVIHGNKGNFKVTDGPYYKGDKEIVGGYLLIKAKDLQEATSLIKDCPVFEFDGFAEIREMM
jgi:hypothetical protein